MTTATDSSNSTQTVEVLLGSGYSVNSETGEILARPSPRSDIARYQHAVGDRVRAYVGQDEAEYLARRAERRAAESVSPIPAPAGGWKRAWQRAGAAAAALYLEQKAKTHKNRESSVESELHTRSDFTCDRPGIWLTRGECVHGSHEVAAEIVCGREWCRKCGQNASPGVEGSKAHRRRISRWLPKAMQLHNIGEWVFTYPLELRESLRDVRELAEDGKSLKRALQRLGYSRGLRRLHWFGEPENGVSGVPIYHPHWNVLTGTGMLSSAELEAAKRVWARLLKRRYGYTGPVNAHYQFATTPGQKYHRVRYVTRATFLNRDWDQQMAEEIIGFRNASTWGKWSGPAVWEPELADAPPSAAAARAALGQCPGEHPEPVEVEYAGIVDSPRLDLDTWRDVGEGFYYRHKREWAGAP